MDIMLASFRSRRHNRVRTTFREPIVSSLVHRHNGGIVSIKQFARAHSLCMGKQAWVRMHDLPGAVIDEAWPLHRAGEGLLRALRHHGTQMSRHEA